MSSRARSRPSARAVSEQHRPLYLRPAPVLLVFAGGAAGTLARYAVGLALPSPSGLPLPTFLVNVVGAFALGLLLEGLLRGGNDVGWRQRLRLLLGPGFLGGFTTYSSLCVETALLTDSGRYLAGGAYAVASLLLGIVAATAGVWIAANLFTAPGPSSAGARSSISSTESLHLAMDADRPPEPAVPPSPRAATGGEDGATG